jgi:hypothetical protein
MMEASLNELLAKIIDAHGGMDRWKAYKKVDVTIVSGGGFFALKGMIEDPDPRGMKVWLHEDRASLLPYGAPYQRWVFTPEKIIIEKVDGTLIAERRSPKDSFAGHQMNTPWDPLHIGAISMARPYGLILPAVSSRAGRRACRRS